MGKIKVNNTEYGYTIEPFFNVVRVEIYKVSEGLVEITGKTFRRHLLDKNFGKWYRKPIEEDYKKARDWAEDQMMCIYRSNK